MQVTDPASLLLWDEEDEGVAAAMEKALGAWLITDECVSQRDGSEREREREREKERERASDRVAVGWSIMCAPRLIVFLSS